MELSETAYVITTVAASACVFYAGLFAGAKIMERTFKPVLKDELRRYLDSLDIKFTTIRDNPDGTTDTFQIVLAGKRRETVN